VIRLLCDHFRGRDFRFGTKVENENTLTAQLEIDQTLYLKIQFDPKHLSEDGADHVTVLSRVMEVSYGHAKMKLERQIIPVLQAINRCT